MKRYVIVTVKEEEKYLEDYGKITSKITHGMVNFETHLSAEDIRKIPYVLEVIEM